jgi:hypothetical protein
MRRISSQFPIFLIANAAGVSSMTRMSYRFIVATALAVIALSTSSCCCLF